MIIRVRAFFWHCLMSLPSQMTLDDFQALVEEALLSLPDEIDRVMDNVAVTVAEHPSAAQRRAAGLGPGQALYGLYQGVPLTHRTSHYGMVPPDRITIFMYPMVHHHRTPEAIRRQVRRTVLHEIGHHFGMGEEQLRRLGY
jgi:predicted Zn-dependent protease with MMP-like domain